jgi:hypothetical protein
MDESCVKNSSKSFKTIQKPCNFPSLSLNGSLLRRASETIDSLWFPKSEWTKAAQNRSKTAQILQFPVTFFK